MNHPFTVTTNQLKRPDQTICYRIYRNPAIESQRKLVLLHGAGVAGVDTWHMLISFLQQWGVVLVPDQRGMGDTYYPDRKEYSFSASELVSDLSALVDHLGWWQFDLGGYSMGGLVSLLYKQQHSTRVSKQFLLESAVLDRPCFDSTIELRQRYTQAAQLLKQQDVSSGVKDFLDAISPNRKITPQTELLTVQRLSARPEGFAYALEAVTEAIHQLDRESLVAAQGDVSSFIGGLSVDLMHQYHAGLAERLPNWHYFLVQGTDHSLPFQKPRQIARVMNQELERFLNG